MVVSRQTATNGECARSLRSYPKVKVGPAMAIIIMHKSKCLWTFVFGNGNILQRCTESILDVGQSSWRWTVFLTLDSLLLECKFKWPPGSTSVMPSLRGNVGHDPEIQAEYSKVPPPTRGGDSIMLVENLIENIHNMSVEVDCTNKASYLILSGCFDSSTFHKDQWRLMRDTRNRLYGFLVVPIIEATCHTMKVIL